jgi:hypothetical protein
MPKFVLQSKSDNKYFLKSYCYDQISFTDNVESAKEICKRAENFDEAKMCLASDFSQLIHSLFQIYEVPEPKYAIRVVDTELYVSSTLYNVQFSELDCAIILSYESEIEMELDKIKNKVKSKLEIVKLQ